MTVYLVTLVLVLFLCLTAEQQDTKLARSESAQPPITHSGNTQMIYLLVAAILICVAGLRYRVGTDFGAYYFGFRDYIEDFWTSLFELHEPGYGFLSWIASGIYDNGAAAIFMASLVTIGLPLAVIYRNTRELALATILLVIMGFWHGSFNGVRQYLAAAVLFCGYEYLRDQKLVKWLLVVFIAFLFHRSAAVMALIYFAVYREIGWKNILILIVITWVTLQSYDRLFDLADTVMDSSYSTENTYTSTLVNRLRVLASCVPAAIFLVEYRGKELSASQTLHMNLVLLYAAIRVATMNSALLYRVGIYTLPFAALAIPELLQGISGKNRRLYTALIVGMYLVMWWYELSNSGSLNHFQWVWQR